MTSWVESPGGGRDRGPRGLGRAWVEVLVRPRRFFRTGVAPGDQGPGLTFAMVVIAIEEGGRLILRPAAVPPLAGGWLLSAALVVGLASLLITPVGLHLLAAVQTLLLRPVVTDRSGVSKTVQVLAYAGAPCVFAGVPIPAVRVLCMAYGGLLLALGLAIVHDTTLWRAGVAAFLPGAVIFGYGFRGFDAIMNLLTTSHLL